MKKKIQLLLLVCVGAASADTFSNQSTWDCKKDPVPHISHSRGKFAFTGECTSIFIPTGKNQVTAESVERLVVDGGANTITVDAVGSIEVNGGGNTITWKKAKSGDKPTIKGDVGKNTITHAN
jgi:hypothetical protein